MEAAPSSAAAAAAEAAPADLMFARAEFWRALDDYHGAQESAEYEDWLARRSAWEEQDSGFWRSVGAKDAKLPSLAELRGGIKKAEHEAQHAVEQDRSGAHTHYRKAARLFTKAAVAAQAAGGEVSAPSWDKTQAAWDYFYATNRLLDARQRGIDRRRAEALTKVLPPTDRSDGVKVAAFVRPWVPFPGCRKGVNSPLCDVAEALHFPRSTVGFTRGANGARFRTSSPGGVGDTVGRDARKQQALAAVKARARRGGTVAGAEHSCEAKCAAGDVSCASNCRAGAQKVAGLDAALGPLNEEQARLNRARMLLYLREFGPLKAMLSSKRLAKTTQLPWYPGDFKQPRSTDCAEPGFCHQWADGQYIDSWAEASTNWDTMGSHQSGYLHWESMARDAWNGGFDNVPVDYDARHYRGDHGDRFGYEEGHPAEAREADAEATVGRREWGAHMEDPDDEEFEDAWDRTGPDAEREWQWAGRDKGWDSGDAHDHQWDYRADGWGRSDEWEDAWDAPSDEKWEFPEDYNDRPRSAQRDGEAQDVDDRVGLYRDLPAPRARAAQANPQDSQQPAGAAEAGSEGPDAESAAAPGKRGPGRSVETKGRATMLAGRRERGETLARRGRFTMLAQLPAFDWAKFNKDQARLERRARVAADMLMSKGLQSENTHKLFVTADPSLASQIKAAQKAQRVKAAVGGLGSWAETHDPLKAGQPGSASDVLQDWRPPRGLPFGGNIASRTLSGGKEAKEASRGRALRRSLRHVAGLMDRQWGHGGSDSLTAPLAAREQRQEAEHAARAAARALGDDSPQRYSEQARLQAPAKHASLEGKLEAATAAIDRALSSSVATHGDDPASARQKAGTTQHVVVARRIATRGAAGAADDGKVWTTATGAAGAGAEAIRRRLKRQIEANSRLRTRLQQAEAEGFGKGYAKRMKSMEESVAKIVASKLSPKVVTLAASKVASDVESHSAEPRKVWIVDHGPDHHGYEREIGRGGYWDDTEHFRYYDEERHDDAWRQHDKEYYDAIFDDHRDEFRHARRRNDTRRRIEDGDLTPAEAERARRRRMVTDGDPGDGANATDDEAVLRDHVRYRHTRWEFPKHAANPEGGEKHQTVVDPAVLAAGGDVRPVRGHAMQAYGSQRLGAHDGTYFRFGGDRRGRRRNYRGKFGHLWVKPSKAKGDSLQWDSTVDPKEIAFHGGRRHMHDECDHYGEAGCSRVWDEEQRKRRSYCATWQGRRHMHRHARRYCFGNYHPGNERDGWASNRAGAAPPRYLRDGSAAGPADWHLSTDQDPAGSRAHRNLTATDRGGADARDGSGVGQAPGEVDPEEGNGRGGAGKYVAGGEGAAGAAAGGGGAADDEEHGPPDGDDEPPELRGRVASTYPGRDHEWQPHYFNHAFWSELYHYFKGDRPDEYCNVCVGEFMTALQDIKIPETQSSTGARAEQVPKLCREACETNTNGGFTYHRPVVASRQPLPEVDAAGAAASARRVQDLSAQANEQYKGGFH